MNDRHRQIKSICLKIVKNDRAEMLMHDRRWFSIMGFQYQLSCIPTQWGKRIYKLLGW